ATFLRQQQIDVLQAHLFDATVVGMAAARLAGTPLVVGTGHHSVEFALRPRGAGYLLDAFCFGQLAHGIIAPSRFMRDTMASTYGIPSEKIAVIPHGLDDRRLRPAPAGARERL